jgi:hypothetical protein
MLQPTSRYRFASLIQNTVYPLVSFEGTAYATLLPTITGKVTHAEKLVICYLILGLSGPTDRNSTVKKDIQPALKPSICSHYLSGLGCNIPRTRRSEIY